MPAHAEHDSREISEAPRGAPSAAEVWRAQRALEARTPGDREFGAAEHLGRAHAALGGRVFRIPTDHLDGLRRRIEQLDRRAHRLGTAPITLLDTGERDAAGGVFVVLRGQAPRLADWTLAAIVTHRQPEPTVRPVAELGGDLDATWLAQPRCEHCGLRRRRTKTFVVIHTGTGETRQIGSGCLRDFVGGHDPDRACRQAECVALARRALADADRAPGTPSAVPHERSDAGSIERFADHAAHVIRAHGWVSREQARRTGRVASADAALRSLHADPEAPTAADRIVASGALRWARGLWPTKSALDTFERAVLAALASHAPWEPRERGLVCALIAVYRRRRAGSHHLAVPGAPLELTVLVERATAQPSARHPGLRRYELIDADGNRLAWWSTAGAPLAQGDVVTLHARVQRHTHFAGTPVTVLTRCRRRPT